MKRVSRLVWVIQFVGLLTFFGTCDAQTQPEKSSRRKDAREAASTKSDSAKPASAATSPVNSTRPNIILINLDDADVDLFTPEILDHYLPNIKRLALEGLNFTNCHVTTPLCGPSRTCLLRGQYAHRTGVKTNVPEGPMNNGFTGAYPVFKSRGYEQEHLGVWMQRAGYRTMMIGKYLHGRVNPDGLPGWDDLHICFGGAYYDTSRYSTRLPEGQRRRSIGKSRYRTVAEADEAVWMIDQQTKRNRERQPETPPQPFFLYIAPLAPHKPAGQGTMLQEEYKDIAKEIRLADTPDLNEDDVSDKPAHLQIAKLDDETMESLHDEHRKRVITVKSVDDLVGQLFETLKTNDLTDNTYIFFTSDHGYQLGHNRMIAKKVPYHRNTVIPMFVYGPNVFRGTSDQLLAQFDLVPTFLELAGGKAPIELDGKSLVPVLSDPASIANDDFRKSLLIQNWEEKSQLGKLVPSGYASLRTSRQIFTEWSNGAFEFYDLDDDPYQLKNAIGSLTPEEKARFSQELHSLKQGTPQPIATIASPELICKDSFIAGKAEDDQGVASVELTFHNPRQNVYWNGKEWQSEPATVHAKLALPNGLLTDWQATLDLSPIKNDGQLVVTARAKDDQGNVSDDVSFTFRVDAVEPETLLKLPARDTTVKSPVIVFGTCGDNQAMRGVELTLRNIDNETFWDGSQWTRTESTFFKRVAGERWHVELEIPPGRYEASARSLDGAGNYDPSPSTTAFIVE